MTNLSSMQFQVVPLLVAGIMFVGLVWRWSPLLNRDVWLVMGLMILSAQTALVVATMSDQIHYYQSGELATMSYGNLSQENFLWPVYAGLGCLAVWAVLELRFRLAFRKKYRAERTQVESGNHRTNEPAVSDETQAFTLDELADAQESRNLRPLHNGQPNVGLDILGPPQYATVPTVTPFV